ncbi:ceramidase domain-containing protein [Paracoccus pacificus]|uniref:Ceramidase domain-containing protein n=1 Tax=Paracoccus pacificus TaxID=1463598 RepID=A0ABW4R4Q7_9RHOB
MLPLLSLTAPVDIYCERLGPAFWAEPANAISNMSFIAAAIWGWREARRRDESNPLVWVLIALAFTIGIGSFLFHTFAQVWASYADTIPIWSFVALYCFVALSRLGGVRPGIVAAGALALIAVLTVWRLAAPETAPETTPAADVPRGPDPLNGSGQYAPAVVAFIIFTIIAFWRHHPLRWWVAGAGLVFLLSLTARTFDRDLCTAFPLGLHWIWHLLNGFMIGLVLQILIRSAPAAGRGAGAPLPR